VEATWYVAGVKFGTMQGSGGDTLPPFSLVLNCVRLVFLIMDILVLVCHCQVWYIVGVVVEVQYSG
jgi:hypothetical protein